METVTIEYQPHVKEELMKFLNTFQEKDLHVMMENKSYENDPEFIAYRNQLHLEVARIKSGESKLYSLEELDAMLDETIAQYER